MNQETRPVHVIFGATGGIGAALAKRLVAGGAEVLLAGRRPEALESLVNELGRRSGSGDGAR